MATVVEVWGLPLARYPEPLQSALVVAFEREYGDQPRARFWPSPLLGRLLDEAARWQQAERQAGRL